MAAVNGVAGKPAKTFTRPPSRVIVPALPLNYPQRPATKQAFATAATPASANGQNGVRPAQDKLDAQAQKQEQELQNGTHPAGQAPSPSFADKVATPAPSAPPAQAVTKAEKSSPVAAVHDREKATPTAPSTFPDRRVVSPVRQRPPGLPYPAPEAMGPADRVLDGPVPAPHPAMMNRPAFHQPHASNGSFIFPGFNDSNASSPAPRAGAAFPPPPGLLPYPAPAVDAYGRALLVSPAVDAFSPNLVNPHGPPTHHSFHGSQSSVHAEDHSFNHYAANGQAPMPPPGMTQPMNGAAVHPSPGSVPTYQSLREQDETLSFLRHAISDHTFNDCMLEVRFPDSPEFQDHPNYRQLHSVLKTPGHRFVLSRSPMLAAAMKIQSTMPGGVIFLEANDEYMRSDVFWYAFRTLYGWSLADGILPTELPLRDVRDDLKSALSYIATARFLQLPWVHSVAVHRASRLVSWSTVEIATKFVSQIVTLSPRNDGFGVPELLEQVLAFIVHNFPADFVLDIAAGDYGFSRLPPSHPTPRNPNTPTIANGTSGGLHSRQPSKSQAHLPRNPRVSSNLRLSQIKFGDLSPAKNGQAPRAVTPNDTVLSRILLNLPFELLKQVLDHPHLAKLSGELSPAARQSIISDIIAERELRRLRVLEKADPQLRVYQERVENATGPLVVTSMDDFWSNNLGFREEVFPGDLPYLVHTWSHTNSSSVSS